MQTNTKQYQSEWEIHFVSWAKCNSLNDKDESSVVVGLYALFCGCHSNKKHWKIQLDFSPQLSTFREFWTRFTQIYVYGFRNLHINDFTKANTQDGRVEQNCVVVNGHNKWNQNEKMCVLKN